jgi:hypothetical protein
MGLKPAEKEKLRLLIDGYLKTDLLFWHEEDRNKFRQWYYELFLESFGQSRRCWVNSINRLVKEIKQP